MGTPSIATARGDGGGSGVVFAPRIVITDSTIATDSAIELLANKVMEQAFGRMGQGRKFSYHTV